MSEPLASQSDKSAQTSSSPQRFSLAVRLLRIVFSIYLVITILITGSQMYNEYQLEKSAIRSNLEAYESIFGLGIATALWNIDDEQLNATLEGVVRLRDIAGVWLQDIDGTTLYVDGITHAPVVGDKLIDPDQLPAVQDTFVHVFPVLFKERKIGTAYFYSSNQIVFDRVKYNFFAIIINALIKTAVLWLLFIWAFKRYLGRALDQFTTKIEATELDSIDSEPDSDSEKIDTFNAPELERLEHVFQSLKQRISESKKRLYELNQNLEERVEERTRAFQKQQAMLESMSDIAKIGAWEYEADSQKLTWSRVTREIHDVGKAFTPDLQNILDFCINSSEKNALRAQIERALSQGTSWHSEYQIRTANERQLWIHFTGQPEWEHGKCVRLYGTYQDITERMSAEQELIRSRDAAEAADTAKSEFLASMSHEIRTPMNGLIGMLSVLLEGKLAEKQKRQAELALSSARSLLALLNDILDFSKIEAGKLDIESIEFDLPRLIQESTEIFALQAQEKDLELIVDMKALNDIPRALGDPNRLRQIISNLIGNAIKFTNRGEIVVRCSVDLADAHSIQFCCDIRDTGIGIPVEKQATIFESFSQVDLSTTRQYGGTGLGLAIVKQLCEMMNGSISVVSQVNQGSSFSFRIELQLPQSHSSTETSTWTQPTIQGSSIALCIGNRSLKQSLSEQLIDWGANVDIVLPGTLGRNLDLSDENNTLIIDHRDLLSFGSDSLESLIKWCQQNESRHLLVLTPVNLQTVQQVLIQLPRCQLLAKPVFPWNLAETLSSPRQLSPGVATSNNHSDNSASDPGESIKQAPRNHDLSGFNILLVEDNKVNQLVTQSLLQQMGLDCDIAENGAEAIEQLQQRDVNHPYHLIFMDCQMPEMDGYTATEKIREGFAGDHYQDVTIVAMTANAMAGDREKCLDAGMNDYLSKPLDPAKLKFMLKEWMGYEH